MSAKDTYVEELHAKIDEWAADIDKLQAKANAAKADSKLKYHKQIESLKSKKEDAKNKLKDLKNSSGDAWEDLKDGVEDSMNSLGKAIKSAVSNFK